MIAPIGHGEIVVNGTTVKNKKQQRCDRIWDGMGYRSRKHQGLILEEDLNSNISLPTVHKHRNGFLIDDSGLRKSAGVY